MMLKNLCFVIVSVTAIMGTSCATAAAASNYVTPTTYNNLYPYMNNKMRVGLNPGQSPSKTNSPINVLTRTSAPTTTRRVVPRPVTNRAAGTARAATTNVPSVSGNATRRVVPRNTTTTSVARSASTGAIARSGTPVAQNRNVVARGARRGDVVSTARATPRAATTDGTTISTARCLADYTECMNGYCQRENTQYNRCYCSAKLSQIDSVYQTSINNLVQKVAQIQGTKKWSDDEMNQYWMDTIGKYYGQNSWTNLDNALNIDWASMESRVRGQNAFVTGHEYCSQHLRACAHMASNLRDAYRSDIARDCAAYEESLQRIKNIAESLVETYK